MNYLFGDVEVKNSVGTFYSFGVDEVFENTFVLGVGVGAGVPLPLGPGSLDVGLRYRTSFNGCYVIAPGQFDVKSKFQAYANSMVVDPWGTVIARAPHTPCVITAEIDLGYVDTVRKQVFTLENRRPDVYTLSSALKG